MKKTARKQLLIHVSPERAFGAQLAFALFRKRAFSNDEKSFTPSSSAKPAVSPRPSSPGGGAQPLKPPAPITAPRPSVPPPLSRPAQPTLFEDMTANSKRVSLGALGAASGGIGTLGLGVLRAGNNIWNGVTPKMMNTSPAFTQGVTDVMDTAADFTQQSANDFVGGITGDKDYHTSRMQNFLEKGYNAPGVDPVTRSIAQTAANAGQATWTTALSLAGGDGAVKVLNSAPGIARAGQALAQVPYGAPAARVLSYVSGLPMASKLNPMGMMASQLGQTFLGNTAAKYDEKNQQYGVDSNYAGLVPMVGIQQGLKNLIGADAANVVNSYANGRFLKSQLPSRLGGADIAKRIGATGSSVGSTVGMHLGAPALIEMGERIYAGQPTSPQAFATMLPQPAPASPSPPIIGATTPPPQPPAVATTPAAQTPAAQTPAAQTTAAQTTAAQTTAAQNSMAAATQPNAPPEAKQQAQSDFQALVQQKADSNPQLKSGATDLLSGDPSKQNSSAAQEFQQHVETVGNDVQAKELQRLLAANPNSTPQQAGGFVAQAQDAWTGLGQHGQMMVGLGAPLALAGMAMSLFGDEDGGMLPMLLGVLGLGMAGLGAAGGGMLGGDAQQMVGGGVRNFANMMGANIPEGNQDLSALLKSPDTALRGVTGGLSNILNINGKIEKAEQLRKITSMPSFLAIPLLRSLDPEHIKTPQDAQAVYANAMAIRQQLDDPNSAPAKSLATAQAVNSGISATGQTINRGINNMQNFATGLLNNAKLNFGG